MTQSTKDNFDKVKRYLGFGLTVIMIAIHVFFKEIDVKLFMIPALIMGIDLSNFIKK